MNFGFRLGQGPVVESRALTLKPRMADQAQTKGSGFGVQGASSAVL